MDIEVISLIEGISNNLNRVEESIVYNKQIRNNKYYRIGDKNIQISIRQKDDLLTYKVFFYLKLFYFQCYLLKKEKYYII